MKLVLGLHVTSGWLEVLSQYAPMCYARKVFRWCWCMFLMGFRRLNPAHRRRFEITSHFDRAKAFIFFLFEFRSLYVQLSAVASRLTAGCFGIVSLCYESLSGNIGLHAAYCASRASSPVDIPPTLRVPRPRCLQCGIISWK